MKRKILVVLALLMVIAVFSLSANAASVNTWNLHYNISAPSADNAVTAYRALDVPLESDDITNYIYASHSMNFTLGISTVNPRVRFSSDSFTTFYLTQSITSKSQKLSNNWATANYTIKLVDYVNCTYVSSNGNARVTSVL